MSIFGSLKTYQMNSSIFKSYWNGIIILSCVLLIYFMLNKLTIFVVATAPFVIISLMARYYDIKSKEL